MTKTKKGKVPPQLIQHHEKRRQIGRENAEMVELILVGNDQPLSVLEVKAAIQMLTDRVLEQNHVRKILDNLVDAGRASTRMETDLEREIRANGRLVRGRTGRFYSAGKGEVPPRTKAEAIEGVVLDSKEDYAKRREQTMQKNSGLLGKKKMQTGTLSGMIEEIIAEHTRSMQARIDELEKKLTDIKKIVS